MFPAHSLVDWSSSDGDDNLKQMQTRYLSNTAACAQSWPTCNVADLLGLGFKAVAAFSSHTSPHPTPHHPRRVFFGITRLNGCVEFRRASRFRLRTQFVLRRLGSRVEFFSLTAVFICTRLAPTIFAS